MAFEVDRGLVKLGDEVSRAGSAVKAMEVMLTGLGLILQDAVDRSLQAGAKPEQLLPVSEVITKLNQKAVEISQRVVSASGGIQPPPPPPPVPEMPPAPEPEPEPPMAA